MNNEMTRVMEKIRKLLNMAERAEGNENEAANAARMAENMLRKYNLSMSDITPEEAKSNVTESAWTDMKWTAGKAPTWVASLIIAVAEAHDCFIVWRRAKTTDSWVAKPQSNLTFVGTEMDAAVAKEVFVYLYRTVNRLTDEWAKDAYIPAGKARTYKNSYRSGMAHRLNERLKEMTAEKDKEFEEAAKTGTSLVVVKKDAIADYLGHATEYSTKKSSARVAGDAYSSGYTKGGSVSMNKQLK